MKNRLGLACLLIGLLTFTTSCSDDDDSVGETVEGGGEVIGGGDEVEEPDMPTTVVINEVNYLGEDWIEIYNPTAEAIDISEYWLCLGAGTYRQFSNAELTIEGNTVLESEGFLVITGYNLPDENAGLGLYSTNEGGFVDPEVLIDFVQYGAAGSQRENVAVEAGLWEADTFVPLIGSVNVNDNGTLVYSGSGVGVDSWSETTEATVGLENIFVAP